MLIEDYMKTLRDIITDCISVDDHIKFDGSIAEKNGYSDLHIHVAEHLLKNHAQFTDSFTDNIKKLYCRTDLNCEVDFNPVIFYVPMARIIFVINPKEQVYTHIYEERLTRDLAVFESISQYLATPSEEDETTRKQFRFQW